MLTCEGLARAYTQCASVGLNSAPLLSALRKASRVKLGSMQPSDLAAVLAALAVLGQQDLLYLDELARCVLAGWWSDVRGGMVWCGAGLPCKQCGCLVWKETHATPTILTAC